VSLGISALPDPPDDVPPFEARRFPAFFFLFFLNPSWMKVASLSCRVDVSSLLSFFRKISGFRSGVSAS